jgi:NAD(P)-dependent dehydrogenase (short-subunit alcohol dehydrogenase family)
MRLQGRVAVITGGGSGLGRECGLLFTEEGARVVLLDRVAARVAEAVQLIRDRGGDAIGVVGDVGVEADVRRAVDTAVSEYGKLDIMLANAGCQTPSYGHIPIEEVTEDEWNDICSTNLTGVIWSVKHAVRVMKERGGAIVVTGSSAALRSFPSTVLYGATKGGVNGLVLNAAREIGKYGIRINCLNPLSGMSANFLLPRDAEVLGKSYEELKNKWPDDESPMLLKLSTPPSIRDNAYGVLFLASDESRYMTGSSLSSADGGVISNVAMTFHENWDADATSGISLMGL